MIFAPLIRIANAAPKPAPLDTPKRSEDTNGFLNIDWNAAPEIARQAPTTIAPIIRGSLISNTIVVIVCETSSCGNNGDNKVLITSTGLIGYLPIKNDAKNKTIGKKIKSIMPIISFDSLSINTPISLFPSVLSPIEFVLPHHHLNRSDRNCYRTL